MHRTQARVLRTLLADLNQPVTVNLSLEVLAAAHGKTSWQKALQAPAYMGTPLLPAQARMQAMRSRLEQAGVLISSEQADALARCLDAPVPRPPSRMAVQAFSADALQTPGPNANRARPERPD